MKPAEAALPPPEATGLFGRSRDPVDQAMTVLIWTIALGVTATFLWIVGDLLVGGLAKLSWSFLIEAPRAAGRAGGIAPIVVSTLILLGICLAVCVPVGIATAVYLAEFTRRASALGRLVRGSLDVLAGVPSIVFGLFGNALFSLYLGLGFSLLSGGLTLACMALPLVIRATESGLRAVPDDYRQAAAALGLSQAALITRVLLPAATPGLLAGLVLGIGRALGETAALLFTSGYVDRMPRSLLDSGRALSVHIYDLAMNVPGGSGNAHASSLVLIALIILINAVTVYLGRHFLQRRITPA